MGRSANVVVTRLPNETSEQLLRRFNRQCQEEGLPREISRRQYFEKPSDVKRHKKQKARRRMLMQRLAAEAEEKGLPLPTRKKRRKSERGESDGRKGAISTI